jgi:hypothetical protein
MPGSPGTAIPRAASRGRTSPIARVTADRCTRYNSASAACGSWKRGRTRVTITRSVNGRSWPGPAPAARSRSCSRRASSRSSPAAAHGEATSPISQPSRPRLIPAQIRSDKAVRANPDDTSRSLRTAARVPGTDTPKISSYAPGLLSCTKSLRPDPVMSVAPSDSIAAGAWRDHYPGAPRSPRCKAPPLTRQLGPRWARGNPVVASHDSATQWRMNSYA